MCGSGSGCGLALCRLQALLQTQTEATRKAVEEAEEREQRVNKRHTKQFETQIEQLRDELQATRAEHEVHTHHCICENARKRKLSLLLGSPPMAPSSYPSTLFAHMSYHAAPSSLCRQ